MFFKITLNITNNILYVIGIAHLLIENSKLHSVIPSYVNLQEICKIGTIHSNQSTLSSVFEHQESKYSKIFGSIQSTTVKFRQDGE